MPRTVVEPLERRTHLAITASFAVGTGILTVNGDAAANSIVVTRDAAGIILINNGTVPVTGGIATVANTVKISVLGAAGADTITLDESLGALPAAEIFGGTENDTVTGGSNADTLRGEDGDDVMLGKGGFDLLFGGNQNDVLTGGDADDQMFGEAGNDRMIWYPGDDTDLNEGGSELDTVEVNGGNAAEAFSVTANGTRVRFDRVSPAPFAIDIGTSETLVLNASGGDDSLSCTGSLAALIFIIADGGAGQDMLLGSNGADRLFGGDGNDFIDGQQGDDLALMGAGDDVFQWDPGDGNDVVEGQSETDTLLFNGGNISETFEASANGGRLRFTRNVGTVLADCDDVERIDVNALGNVDTMTVNDLSGTDVTQVNVDLAGTVGGVTGDAAVDTVIVNGTSVDDVITLTLPASLLVSGVGADVTVEHFETTDIVRVNALGDDDVIDASAVGAAGPGIQIDGGPGNDIALGSAGNNTLLGGDADDVLLGMGGADVFDGGLGENITIGGPALPTSGIFSVFGDASTNAITISRDAAGLIYSNGVPIPGATVANTALIRVFGRGGSDVITLNEASGALPAAALFGGGSNDTLTGGSGPDLIFGGAGADALLGKGGNDYCFGGIGDDTATGGDADDLAFGEAGNDRFIWNPGDDTDLNEGGSGSDTVEVNGGNAAEAFTTTANGTRVRFDRTNPAPFSIDIGTSENLVLNANPGDDSFSATGNLAALIRIFVDGGAGNDTVLGSNGPDTLLGGDNTDFIDGQPGDDLVLMGAGADVFQWDPGDGNDVVEGQADIDTLLFNGNGSLENFDFSANGGRLRLTRNLGSVVMDCDDLERIDLDLAGNIDNATVNSLAGTDVTLINLEMGAVADAQVDNVVINGTDGFDGIVVNGDAGGFAISGLSATVNVLHPEPVNDLVTLMPLNGADTVTVNNITGLDTAQLKVDLAVSRGSANPDAFGDQVIMNGNNNANTVNVIDTVDTTEVTGIGPKIIVTHAEAINDYLRINALGGADTINVNQNSILGAVRQVFIDAGPETDSINVINTTSNGAARIFPSAGNDSVAVNTDNLFGANATFEATQRIGSLTIGTGGRATLAAGASRVLTVGAVTLGGTARLDLTNNDLIVDYTGGTVIATIQSFLGGGYNGGPWTGSGIMTSIGNATTLGLGNAEASEVAPGGMFSGQPVDSTAVVVKFTFYGDANLSGAVDVADLGRLASNWQLSPRRWTQGNFNYDSIVNVADLGMLASNWQSGVGSPLAPATARTTQASLAKTVLDA